MAKFMLTKEQREAVGHLKVLSEYSDRFVLIAQVIITGGSMEADVRLCTDKESDKACAAYAGLDAIE